MFKLQSSMLATAIAMIGAQGQPFGTNAVERWSLGSRMKRARIGSKNGFRAAKKRRNRIRNRIAARSRAANR